MDWILENWYIAVCLLGGGAVIGIGIYKFWQLPLAEKKSIIGSFLLGLMIQAEKNLQTAEGQARFEVVLSEFYASKIPTVLKTILSYEKLKEFAQFIFEKNKTIIESANEVKKAKEEQGAVTIVTPEKIDTNKVIADIKSAMDTQKHI
jgi:hypothetical protein